MTTATQRLLGDTIALADVDWQAPTLLPGWSRAHVATHLAHHGQALAAMAGQIARTRQPVTWDVEQPDSELHAGARRPALALQEALDQCSAAVATAFDAMDEAAWAVTVQTSQGALPASVLVLDCLNETVIHHVDLRLGFDFADIDPSLTRSLLQWNLFRAQPRFARVSLEVTTDEGLHTKVGHGPAVTVRGNETNILGWLTGRKDPSAVLGAEELDLSGPA